RDNASQWETGPPIRVPFHSVDRFVGIQINDWRADVGGPVSFETIVVDPQGVSVEQVQVQLTLSKNVGSYRAENWQQVDSCELKSQLKPSGCTLTVKTSGRHRITAVVSDKNGQTHSSVESVYAYGKQRDNQSQEIAVVVSDKNPKLGQTIQVDFLSPFASGKIRLALTRNEVLKYYWLDVKNHQAQLSLTVDEALWPGFSLIAYTRSDNIDIDHHQANTQYSASGRAKVEINAKLPNLPIDIKTDKTDYQPGEQVKLSLRSSTKQSVEYTVAVIDEGYISNVANYDQYYDWKNSSPHEELRYWTAPQTYDLLRLLVLPEPVGAAQYLYADGNNDELMETITISGSAISYSRLRHSGNAIPLLAPGSDADQGANSKQLGQNPLNSADIRSVFKRAAVWLPAVKSDDQGEANVSFTLPDNLTNFKIMVLENTPTGDINFASGDIKVKQPLEIRARLPQHLVVGDDFVAQYSIVNQSEQTAMQTSALTLLDNTTQQWQQQKQTPHKLEPTERFTLNADIKVGSTPSLTLSLNSKGTYKDAVLNTVPVASLFQTKTLLHSGLLTGDSELIRLGRPADIAGQSRLLFDFSPDFSNQLTGAFDYLEYYPHRCWEQRLSRAVQEGELTSKTLSEYSGFQSDDGGMTFWGKNGAVSDYLSAYTLNVYYWLKTMGYPTQKDQRDDLIRFLQKMDTSRYTPLSIQAMVVNALAGYRNDSRHFELL
ncbi:MAG: hypothetical protein MJK04_12820, partial [Psychrosphaera sp.]|nr:hypothetical protein [Psychrosphaera sp.]